LVSVSTYRYAEKGFEMSQRIIENVKGFNRLKKRFGLKTEIKKGETPKKFLKRTGFLLTPAGMPANDIFSRGFFGGKRRRKRGLETRHSNMNHRQRMQHMDKARQKELAKSFKAKSEAGAIQQNVKDKRV